MLQAVFSTTGPIERVVSQISLMDTMKNYFEFAGGILACGITKLHFMGTLEDWWHLVEKTKALRVYDCKFWIDQLVPILQEFVKTYQGEVDLKFWNNIFCHNYAKVGSGHEIRLSGWILTFFPYDKNDSVLLNMHYSNLRVSMDKIPCYAAKVPFKLALFDESCYDMMFLAGFSNVVNENGRFRPQLSAGVAWCEGMSDEKIKEVKSRFKNNKEN